MIQVKMANEREFAMAVAIALRGEFDAITRRQLARQTRDANQSRRLLALAEIYDGGERRDRLNGTPFIAPLGASKRLLLLAYTW